MSNRNDELGFGKIFVNVRQGSRLVHVAIVGVATFVIFAGVHIVHVTDKVLWFVDVKFVIFMEGTVQFLVTAHHQLERVGALTL